MKCLFCGGSTDFMTTLKNVCLSCGDKLQAQGVMVLSLERYRNMENEIERMKAELEEMPKTAGEILEERLKDNPPLSGEKNE